MAGEEHRDVCTSRPQLGLAHARRPQSGAVGVLPLMGLGLYSTVMSVLAAIAVNDGKPYRYPGTLELIK